LRSLTKCFGRIMGREGRTPWEGEGHNLISTFQRLFRFSFNGMNC
jgi:hypothetical protein